jgi:flagellar L-ring protein precursor FlgH
MRNLTGLFCAGLLSLFALGGCSTAERSVQPWAASTARPQVGSLAPVGNGSLFPQVALAGGATGGWRPLFEDRRARQVGDTLTVSIDEATTASKAGGNKAERKNSLDQSVVGAATAAGRFPSQLAKAGVTFASASTFDGKGTATENNSFVGAMSVTVLDVLANGNLIVAGEKQVAIGDSEEFIRFSGVVNPTMMIGNSVRSTQVADARLEYRSRGTIDDAMRPGWFSRAFSVVNPF